MAEVDENGDTPAMTLEQHKAYKVDLANELHDLEFAQNLKPTEYKARRIKTLRQRLGLDKE